MIERILRVAQSFEEVEEFDRQDMARLSLEERVSAVEQLRRTWFGEAPTQSIANERASGRDKDLRDVAMLEALRSTRTSGTRKAQRTKKPRAR